MLSLDLNDVVLFASEFQGIAYTRVREGYRGPCEVRIEAAGRDDRVVLPDVYEANRAAKFAVGDVGGYEMAVVVPAPDAKVTHRTWTSWAFGHPPAAAH